MKRTTVPDSSADVGERGRAVLHVGHHRALESGWYDVALPVHGGRDGCVGVGIRPGGGAVDGDAAVPPERGAERAGPDAGRRNNRDCQRFSPRRRMGRRAGPAVPSASPVPVPWSRCCRTCLPIRATHSCRCASSPRHPSTPNSYHEIEKRYGCRIVTMYGMTEAFPIAVKGVADDGVPGTSGRPNPNFDVRIVDDDGNPLPAGAVGEITCRPRHQHVMSEGYVRQGDVRQGDTRGLHVDPHQEWFRTGDLGKLDADQNLTYVDRVKDSLRRRGENVSSVEVETVVMRHPAVLEAAAVGVPSRVGRGRHLADRHLAPRSRAGLRRACSISALPGCRTSACPDSSRRLTNSRRTSLDGYAKTYCAAGVSARGHGIEKKTATSLAGKLRVCYVGAAKLSYCYVISSRFTFSAAIFAERLTSTDDQHELSGTADARRRNGRDAILNLNARHNRAYSDGDRDAWIATFRHSGRHLHPRPRRVHRSAHGIRRRGFGSAWSASITRSKSTA